MNDGRFLLLATAESPQPLLLPCYKYHIADVFHIKLLSFNRAGLFEQGCSVSTTIMWKISTHMMPTCCPALFYEGHSCDTETGLFKGSGDVYVGGLVIFNRNKADCNALTLNVLQQL